MLIVPAMTSSPFLRGDLRGCSGSHDKLSLISRGIFSNMTIDLIPPTTNGRQGNLDHFTHFFKGGLRGEAFPRP